MSNNWPDEEVDEHVMTFIPSRDELDAALVNVLSNAMNYPDPVSMLGKDTEPLRKKVVDAVLALLESRID